MKWCLNCKEQKQNCTLIGRLPCPTVHDPMGTQEIWVPLQTLLPSSSVTLEKLEFQSLAPIWRSVFKRSWAPNILSSFQLRGRRQELLLWDHTLCVPWMGTQPVFDSSEHLGNKDMAFNPNTFLIHVHLLDLLIHTRPFWLIASMDFSPLNFSNRFLKNFILEHVQWTLQFKAWLCQKQGFCLKTATGENRVTLRTLSSHLTRKKVDNFVHYCSFSIAVMTLQLQPQTLSITPLPIQWKVFSWEEVLFLLLFL